MYCAKGIVHQKMKICWNLSHPQATGGSVIMDYCSQKKRFKVKHSWWLCFLQTHIFSPHKILTGGLEWCGLLWCFYQLFDFHFDGTHSLPALTHLGWHILLDSASQSHTFQLNLMPSNKTLQNESLNLLIRSSDQHWTWEIRNLTGNINCILPNLYIWQVKWKGRVPKKC